MRKLILFLAITISGCAYNYTLVNNYDGTVTIKAAVEKPTEFTTDAQASVIP